MPTMTIFSHGAAGPDLYFCADHGEAERVFALLTQSTDAAFRLLAFQVEDWNRDLSPWPAPPASRPSITTRPKSSSPCWPSTSPP